MPDREDKVLRDPLYGYIDLNPQEVEILDTPVFQRLRGVKQVAHTFLVYPSAIHTRFTHSIGAMHVAGRMATQLRLSKEEARIVRLAALLHDLGHGPFSHLFEELCKTATGESLDHERVGQALMSFDRPMARALGGDRRRVLEVLEGNAGISSKIVSGGVDCDKMDYFRRDSYHAGVRYGEYDFERILRTLKSHNGHIVVPEKGWDAIEGFLLAREQLYLQVYYHKTRIIADEMLKRVIELGAASATIDRRYFRFDPDSPSSFLDNFSKWDDDGFVAYLHQNTSGNAGRLLSDLLARRLLKKALYCDLSEIDAIPRGRLTTGTTDLLGLENYVAEKTHAPKHLVFAKIPAINMKQYYLRGKEELLALRDSGKTENFLDVAKMHGPLEDIVRLLVFCPEHYRVRAAAATTRYIQTLN